MKQNPSGAVHPLRFLVVWVVLAFGLQRVAPLPFPSWRALAIVGLVLWIVGGALLVWAQFELWKYKTTDSHFKPSTALVTTGPFARSRHPVYLGLLLIMLGMGIRYGNSWALLFALLFLPFLYRFTITQEEAYLARVFEDRYERYQLSVRRWI